MLIIPWADSYVIKTRKPVPNWMQNKRKAVPKVNQLNSETGIKDYRKNNSINTQTRDKKQKSQLYYQKLSRVARWWLSTIETTC